MSSSIPGLLILTACSGNSSPGIASRDPCAGAWVRLFEDAGLAAGSLTIAYPTNQPSLVSAGADSGSGNLNDRVSSVQWSIPVGCRLVLYEDENFLGTRHQLVGSGRIEQDPLTQTFNDTASSARWERG